MDTKTIIVIVLIVGIPIAIMAVYRAVGGVTPRYRPGLGLAHATPDDVVRQPPRTPDSGLRRNDGLGVPE